MYFNDNELATVELEYKFIKKNINKFSDILIHINKMNYKAIIIDLSSYFDIDLLVKLNALLLNFDIEKYVKLKYNSQLDYDYLYENIIPKGFIIISEIINLKEIKKFDDSIIHQLKFYYKDYHNIKMQIFEVLENASNQNLILDPQLLEDENDVDFEVYRKIVNDYSTTITNNNKVSLTSFHLPTATIRDHPCNVFLCSNKFCHSQKSNIPRYIFIDSNGEVYPFKITNPKLLIGNIIDLNFDLNRLILDYKNSINHICFLTLNEQVFKNIIQYRIPLIPWVDLLTIEVRKLYVSK